MITTERIRQFLTGEAAGDSTDYQTPVFVVGNERHQFYFERDGARLMMQITIDGRYGGRMALNLEAVDHLAKVFNAARSAMYKT